MNPNASPNSMPLLHFHCLGVCVCTCNENWYNMLCRYEASQMHIAWKKEKNKADVSGENSSNGSSRIQHRWYRLAYNVRMDMGKRSHLRYCVGGSDDSTIFVCIMGVSRHILHAQCTHNVNGIHHKAFSIGQTK